MAKRDGQRDRVAFALCALFALVLGMLAVQWGQTTNWDLRNYHLYGAWAWLHDRAAYDLAPAQLQSFFNPLLYVPIYFLLEGTRPELSAFVLGAVQGLNLVPLYLIARRVCAAETPPWLLLLAAIVGATGATQLGELGATQGDNLVSLPFLAALSLLIGMRAEASAARLLVARLGAGVLLGAATGLKLTLVPLAFGVVAALPLLDAGPRASLRLVAPFVVGAAIGGLASSGFWMWELWQRYGNPLYPMLSGVFESRWSMPFGARDLRWVPDGAIEALTYPFQWLADSHLVSEMRFRDLRLPLLFAFVVALTFCRGCRARLAPQRTLVFLLAAFVLGYAGWLALFGYYRYLAVWEMLAPVVLVGALSHAAADARYFRAAIALLLAVIALSTDPADWGRLARNGDRFLEVALPPEFDYRDAMVTLAGGKPIAYLALRFPPATRFVLASGNFLGHPMPVHEMDREAARRIDAHRGPLYVMHQEQDVAAIAPALARLGLQADVKRCRFVRSNLVGVGEPDTQLCPALRKGSARAALAALQH